MQVVERVGEGVDGVADKVQVLHLHRILDVQVPLALFRVVGGRYALGQLFLLQFAPARIKKKSFFLLPGSSLMANRFLMPLETRRQEMKIR